MGHVRKLLFHFPQLSCEHLNINIVTYTLCIFFSKDVCEPLKLVNLQYKYTATIYFNMLKCQLKLYIYT